MKKAFAVVAAAVAVLLGVSAAKPHGVSKSHSSDPPYQHEMTNRLQPLEHRQYEQESSDVLSASFSSITTPTASHIKQVHDDLVGLHQHLTEHNIERKNLDDDKLSVTASKGIKRNVTEVHLIDEKGSPQNSTKNMGTSKGEHDGIPMESERLIHVTPKPLKGEKLTKKYKKVQTSASSSSMKKKNHRKNNGSTASKPHHKHSNGEEVMSKPKNHRPPKKYNPKKHGWKKTTRKDRTKDKVKNQVKEKIKEKGKGKMKGKAKDMLKDKAKDKVKEKIKEKRERRDKKTKAAQHHLSQQASKNL